jgi:hypothetical protein
VTLTKRQYGSMITAGNKNMDHPTGFFVMEGGMEHSFIASRRPSDALFKFCIRMIAAYVGKPRLNT